MKLWHDDVRPPPPGWMWVRTNEQAKAILETGRVEEISLDHDLGYHDVELPDDRDALAKVFLLRGQSEETGLQLVEWMCATGTVPGSVTIHSWNKAGARRMAALLAEAGYSCVLRPFTVPKRRRKTLRTLAAAIWGLASKTPQ